jgi:VanZ family protein
MRKLTYRLLNIQNIPLLLWMLVIFKFSSEDHSQSAARSDAVIQFVASKGFEVTSSAQTFETRKLAHFSLYFVLGFLVYNVARTKAWGRGLMVKLSVPFCALYAASDEFHQMFVPGRSPELRDVLIDTTAACLGLLLFVFIESKLKARKARA